MRLIKRLRAFGFCAQIKAKIGGVDIETLAYKQTYRADGARGYELVAWIAASVGCRFCFVGRPVGSDTDQ